MKELFCVCCQKKTEHAFSVAKQEFHAICSACQHVVKFPKVASAQELQGMIYLHNEHNIPVITAAKEEELNAEMQGLLKSL